MASPSTTFSYHVAGPIVPQLNIGGSSSFVPVGVCYDGADLTFRIYSKDIKDDGGGGPEGAEVEVIFLNMTVDVRFTLVPYGGIWMNRMRQFAEATAAEGVMSLPGTLYGMNGFLPSLLLPSIDIDGGWLFTQGRLTRLGDHRLNTKDTNPTFEFRAFNFLNPSVNTTILNKILYARV